MYSLAFAMDATQLDMGGREKYRVVPPPSSLWTGCGIGFGTPVRSWLGRLDGRNHLGARGMFQIMENAKGADWMGSGVTRKSILEERKGDYGQLATAKGSDHCTK